MSNRKRKSTERINVVSAADRERWAEQCRIKDTKFEHRRGLAKLYYANGVAGVHALIDRYEAEAQSLNNQLNEANRWKPGGVYNLPNARVTEEKLRELANAMMKNGQSLVQAEHSGLTVTLAVEARGTMTDRIAHVEKRQKEAAENEELRALLRRAIGVITDMDRTRGEVRAVLDAFAKL